MQFLSKKQFRFGLLALGALLLAATVMFPVLGALEWFALVPTALVLFDTAETENTWKKRLRELVFFFGIYFLAIYHWFFYMYPMSFLGIPEAAAAVVVVVAWIGLAFLASVPMVFLFLLWKPVCRTPFVQKHKWLTPFLAGALWVVGEWVTTLTWLGVPWSRLALGQTKALAILQTVSVLGSYFITFLIVSVAFCLGYAFYYRKRLFVAVPIILFALNLTAGGIMLAGYETRVGESVRMAAVQGNVSSSEKWSAGGFIDSIGRHRDMTFEAGQEGADIVVWCESVVPDVLADMPTTLDFIGAAAKNGDCLMLMGAFDADADGDQYNALLLFDRDGKLLPDRYYKRRLVPFGEYVPLRALIETVIPPLANVNAFGEDLHSGKGSMLIETEYGRIGGLICFDSIYEELARESVRDGANIIVLSTNDSWFGDSAALYMHNAQAVLRAIENRRFVVRAANTGISSFISPTGEVYASLGAGETGYLLEDVYMHTDVTPYTAVGNVFVILCGTYVAILFGMYLISKKKKA